MRYGLTLASLPTLERPRFAPLAQQAGFESIWSPDGPGGDGIIALALMAAAAPEVRVGSGILRAFSRHPVAIASAFANLAALSRGGVVLGLGTGTKRQNLYQLGLDVPRPAPRLRSVIGMVRAYWDSAARGEPFTWEDEFFTISNVRAAPSAGAARARREPAAGAQIPIWIAAVNPGMLRLAADVADGLNGHPIFSAEYIRDVVRPAIEDRRRSKGVERPFELAAWAMTAIDRNRDRARHLAARQIAYFLSTRSYHHLLEYYGCGHLAGPLREAVLERSDLDAAAALFPPEVIERIAVIGASPEELAAGLARYRGVVDTVVLHIPEEQGGLEERIREVEAVMALPRLLQGVDR